MIFFDPLQNPYGTLGFLPHWTSNEAAAVADALNRNEGVPARGIIADDRMSLTIDHEAAELRARLSPSGKKGF